MTWAEKPLSEIAKVSSGQSAPQDANAFTEKGRPFIRAGSLKFLSLGKSEAQCEKITDENAKKFKLKLYPKDTIVFAKSGMSAKIGRVCRLKQSAYIVSHLATVIPNEGVDPSFLMRWFEKNPPSRLIPNEAYPSIRTSEISMLKISLPPLEEQKQIAAILDKADAICKKRKQAIELTEQFLRSAFLDMFGDPITNPKGWDIVPLQDLLEEKAINGAYYPKEDYSNDGITMVHMADAFNGKVSLEGIKRVRASEVDVNKFGLRSTDILVSRRSLTYKGAAKPCLIPSLEEPLIFESSLIRIRPDQSKVLTSYLFNYLQNDAARSKYVFPLVTRSTISGINQSNLMKVKVILPPLDVQRHFSVVEESTEEQGNLRKSHLLKLDTLFNSLQSRAFRGEL